MTRKFSPIQSPQAHTAFPDEGGALNARLLRGVMDEALGFSALCDAEGRILTVDRKSLELGGLTLEEARGQCYWEGPWWAHDEVARTWIHDACRAAAKGETRGRELHAQLGDGSQLWIDFQVKPLRDADGVIRHIVPSGIDSSVLLEHRARIDTLLGEVNHRTKNLLAIVQSVARHIAAHTAPEDVAMEIAQRIGSLSATQDLFIATNWGGVDLAKLAHVQLVEFCDLPEELVQIDGERVELSPQTAQTLGLALFELGCGGAARLNAEDAPRRFALDWRIEGDQFHLRWTEVDGEMEPRPPLNPFSALVLDQMTPAALYGSTAWESGEGQRAWALDCPLSKITVPVLD